MLKYILVALLVLFSLDLRVYGQAPLTIDPQFDQTRIDFNLWNNVVAEKHDSLTAPFGLPELKIDFLAGSAFGGCGTILFGIYPQNKTDISDGVYHALTHEYGHAKNCTSLGLGSLEEGRVESEVDLTYRALSRTNPSVIPSTKLFMASTLNNLPINVISGAKSFYNNTLSYSYHTSAAKFELLANKLPGKNFNRLHRELPSIRGVAEYYAMLDRISGKINGVLPSTFFQANPATFQNGPDGRFFGLYAFHSMGRSWNHAQSPVNPDFVYGMVIKRENGINRMEYNGVNYGWQVIDAFGNIKKTGINIVMENNELSEGAFKVSGCLLNGNVCDPSFRDTSFFPIYRRNWERGKIIIMANGPNFEDLNNQTRITLINPPVGVYTETYPGLLVVNLNGSQEDIIVTDGRRTRTFTPDHELSRIVFFTDRDQPYLYSVTNGASFNTGTATIKPSQAVVPNSIATVFSWGTTHTDPVQSSALPLLTESCDGGQGKTKVVFVDKNSRENNAPIFYCSQGQINFQVPSNLVGLDRTRVCLDLNGTRSNCLEVAVAEADPGIFVTDWTTMTGAVIFQDGGLVTNQRPAQDGDILSIYATGLGAVSNPVPDGYPAPNSPLSNTLNIPTVIVDGMEFPASFSGLAPGFVGLNQVNFTVPTGLSPGVHQLSLSIRGLASNAVNIITR